MAIDPNEGPGLEMSTLSTCGMRVGRAFSTGGPLYKACLPPISGVPGLGGLGNMASSLNIKVRLLVFEIPILSRIQLCIATTTHEVSRNGPRPSLTKP